MDAYARLKAEAAANRDEAITRARVEYQQSLAKISDLRARLRTRNTHLDPKRRIIIDLIQDVMPRDRPFTMAECVTLLKRAEPNRIFFQASVRTTMHKLVKSGAVRRIRKHVGRTLYAAAECAGTPSEFEAKPLSAVAECLLRESGPMTVMELVVAMRARGYRADDDPRRVRESLIVTLRRNLDRFSMDERERWAVCTGV